MLSFDKTYTIPFKYQIPRYEEEFFQSTTIIHRWLKFARRYLLILLNRNISLEKTRIAKDDKNILWINLSAPSIGDSLMDLSSRSLLKDKNIDLFTDKKNHLIYKDDNFFQEIIIDEKKLTKNYDLIIVDSYSSRSMRVKFKYFKKLSFVSMFGFYNGIDVNRILFSFHRMNQLLDYPYNEDQINNIAQNKISITTKDKTLIQSINLPKSYITIALGGEWEYRTYKKWQEVIKQILLYNQAENIVVIGSNNALPIANEITKSCKIKNMVAKYSFNQTIQIIKNSKLLLCCDGGIMHGANSSNTKIIALFAQIDPKIRLTKTSNVYPIYDKNDVNNISVAKIMKKYKEIINK